MCKIAWLRSLLFWVAIDLDFQSQIWLKKSNFLVSPLLEIHNHHITTRCHEYLDSFTGLTVLWSPSSAHTYIPRLFHGLNTLHLYWSRQPGVFRRLPSLLYCSLFPRTFQFQHQRGRLKHKTKKKKITGYPLAPISNFWVTFVFKINCVNFPLTCVYCCCWPSWIQ